VDDVMFEAKATHQGRSSTGDKVWCLQFPCFELQCHILRFSYNAGLHCDTVFHMNEEVNQAW